MKKAQSFYENDCAGANNVSESIRPTILAQSGGEGNHTLFQYRYVYTTCTDQPNLLNALCQVANGEWMVVLPNSVNVYYIEYMLPLDPLSLRRMAKRFEHHRKQGIHTAIFAEHDDLLWQFNDTYLRKWMVEHCLLIDTNINEGE